MSKPQTKEEREYILANLPARTRRVLTLNQVGKQSYKVPADVDPINDEIALAMDGSPIIMRGKPGRGKRTRLPPATPAILEVSDARDGYIATSIILKEA